MSHNNILYVQKGNNLILYADVKIKKKKNCHLRDDKSKNIFYRIEKIEIKKKENFRVVDDK